MPTETIWELFSPNDITMSCLAPYLQKALSTKVRDEFVREYLPSHAQVALEQSFGKDSCSQSFFSEVNFRHTILYLYNLGWLSNRDRSALEADCPLAKCYVLLWKQHRHVDFRPAQGCWDNWKETTMLDGEGKCMITACFMHYLCNTPTVV
jgi:hypothetical protein